MFDSEEVISHIFFSMGVGFNLFRLDLGLRHIREYWMFDDFLFLEGGLEELTVEFLSASWAILSIVIDLHPEISYFFFKPADIFLMLISGALCSLSIFFFLHFGSFLLGEFGVSLGKFILFDMLLFVWWMVLSGELVVLTGTGGGLAFRFAHMLKECF